MSFRFRRPDLSMTEKYKRLQEGQRIWVRRYSTDREGDIQDMFEENQRERVRELMEGQDEDARLGK
jgi:cold shock CspA family protein